MYIYIYIHILYSIIGYSLCNLIFASPMQNTKPLHARRLHVAGELQSSCNNNIVEVSDFPYRVTVDWYVIMIV